MKKFRHIFLCALLCLPAYLLPSQVTRNQVYTGFIDSVSQQFPLQLIRDGQRWVDSLREKSLDGTSMGYFSMARGFNLLGKDIQALDALDKAIELAKASGNMKLANEALLMKSEVYLSLSRYEETANSLFQLLETAETQNDSVFIVLALNGLGGVYRSFGEYSKAHSHLEKALKISSSLNDPRCLSISRKNFGTYYYYLKDYRQASKYYLESYEYWRSQADHEEKGGLINNIGNTARQMGSYQEAFQYYNQALDMANKLGYNYLNVVVLKNIGVLLHLQGASGEALQLLEKAGRLAKEYHLKRVEMDILLQQANFFSSMGDYKRAFLKISDFEHLKDSVLLASHFQKTIQMINAREAEKDQKRSEELREGQRVAELLNSRNYLFLAVLVLALAIVIIILVYNNIARQKVNNALHLQNDEIQHQKDEVDKLIKMLNDSQLRLASVIDTKTYELHRTNELLLGEIDERKSAEKSLREFQDYLLELLDGVADPVFVKDEQHRWILLNDAACKLFGNTREEMIGKSDFDFFPAQEAKVFWEKDDVVLQTGTENTNLEMITSCDGQLHTIETKKKRYVNASGEKFIVGIISDITEQQHLQQQIVELNEDLERKILERTHQLRMTISQLHEEVENRSTAESELRLHKQSLQNILDHVPVGIITIDGGACISMLNLAAQSILSIDKALLGQDFFKAGLCLQEDEKITAAINALLDKGKAFQLEPRKFGMGAEGVLYLQCTGVQISDKQGAINILVISDVTERQLIAEELQAKNEMVEESDRLKSNFLSNMSHEFKTPLNGIMGSAELLSEAHDDDFSRSMVQNIQVSGNRLLKTLDAILILSKLQCNEITPSLMEVDCIPLIHQQVLLFKEAALEKKLSLVFDGSGNIPVRADKYLLAESIKSLIDNAIKFTHAGSVRLYTQERIYGGKPIVSIFVEDTGIGIPITQQELVFQAFRQASEGWSRHYEGNGLGLTIARLMIELMGGTITLDRESGKGSLFCINLPLIQA